MVIGIYVISICKNGNFSRVYFNYSILYKNVTWFYPLFRDQTHSLASTIIIIMLHQQNPKALKFLFNYHQKRRGFGQQDFLHIDSVTYYICDLDKGANLLFLMETCILPYGNLLRRLTICLEITMKWRIKYACPSQVLHHWQLLWFLEEDSGLEETGSLWKAIEDRVARWFGLW